MKFVEKYESNEYRTTKTQNTAKQILKNKRTNIDQQRKKQCWTKGQISMDKWEDKEPLLSLIDCHFCSTNRQKCLHKMQMAAAVGSTALKEKLESF